MSTSLLLLLGFLAYACAEQKPFQRQDAVNPPPARLFQWHQIFVWNNPNTWLPQRDRLSQMCELVRRKAPENAHIYNVQICCEKATTFHKLRCFKIMQEEFLDLCCLRRVDTPTAEDCCIHQGEERYRCFYERPEKALCHGEFRFNHRFQTVRRGENDITFIENKSSQSSSSSSESSEKDDGSSSSSSEQIDGQNARSSSSSSSSSSAEQTEEIPAWLTPEGLEEMLGEEGGGCRRDVFPESGLEDLPATVDEEICQTRERHQCSRCCKIGAAAGKKSHQRGCPYLQCRRMFMDFFKKHKKCIKHPHVCGYFFVTCCERQRHKDMYSFLPPPPPGDDILQ